MRYTKLSLKNIYKLFFKAYRPYLGTIVIASILINLFSLVIPLFIMNVYDRVVPNLAFETLWVLASGALLFFLFEFIIRYFRHYLMDIVGGKVDTRLSCQLFAKLTKLKPEQVPSSDIFAYQIQGFESVRECLTASTIMSFVDIPFLLLFLFVIFFLAGHIVLIPLVGLGLILFLTYHEQRKSAIPLQRAQRFQKIKHNILIQTVRKLSLIKQTAFIGTLAKTWRKIIAELLNTHLPARRHQSINQFGTAFITQVMLVTIIIAGVYAIDSGTMSIGGLIATVLLSARLLTPLTPSIQFLSRYHQQKYSIQSLEQLLNAEEEVDASNKIVFSAPPYIKLESLTLMYPKNKVRALNNINAIIRPGERIAILGQMGSGKTTLLKMLLGNCTPQKGRLLLNDHDILLSQPQCLRPYAGYLDQNFPVFPGTVKENMTLGLGNVAESHFKDIAQASGVSTFISRLPKGFETFIAEDARNISGGQRQTIALARALMNSPHVLLLDEPTSQFDTTAENLFIKHMANFIADKTLLLVTHKKNMLSLVNRVIVMHEGKIIADGQKEVILAQFSEGD